MADVHRARAGGHEGKQGVRVGGVHACVRGAHARKHGGEATATTDRSGDASGEVLHTGCQGGGARSGRDGRTGRQQTN